MLRCIADLQSWMASATLHMAPVLRAALCRWGADALDGLALLLPAGPCMTTCRLQQCFPTATSPLLNEIAMLFRPLQLRPGNDSCRWRQGRVRGVHAAHAGHLGHSAEGAGVAPAVWHMGGAPGPEAVWTPSRSALHTAWAPPLARQADGLCAIQLPHHRLLNHAMLCHPCHKAKTLCDLSPQSQRVVCARTCLCRAMQMPRGSSAAGRVSRRSAQAWG